MLRSKNETTTEAPTDNSNSMALLDKMSLWERKARCDDAKIEVSDLFEGVPADDKSVEEEDGPVSQSELSKYCKAIIGSPSYDWFIASLLKESSFHWDESKPRTMVDAIRQHILQKLSTGTISKRRNPVTHKATFKLMRAPLERRLAQEDSDGLTAKKGISDILVFICSSPDQIQCSTIKEYLNQTWINGGAEIVDALQRWIDNQGRIHAGGENSSSYHQSLTY